MCCCCWTRREIFQPRFLLRHRDQFNWWLLGRNHIASDIWTANSFVSETELLDGPSSAQLLRGKLCILHGAGCLDSVLSHANGHSPACFCGATAVYSGCLTPAGLPGEGRAAHEVWERSGGWSQWSDVREAAQDDAVWAPGSHVCLQEQAAVGVSTDGQSCTIW